MKDKNIKNMMMVVSIKITIWSKITDDGSRYVFFAQPKIKDVFAHA
jgi:hypothetical protein